jgi:hypothetical protein
MASGASKYGGHRSSLATAAAQPQQLTELTPFRAKVVVNVFFLINLWCFADSKTG